MGTTEPRVRRIRADEAEAYRDVRLRALRDAPAAFGEPYDQALARPREDYAMRVAASTEAKHSVIVVAERDGDFVGLAGGNATGNGVVELVSMWVASEARRAGIGERLVDAVVEWAGETGARAVHLRVAAGNDTARRLYERCGFVATGDCSQLRSNPSLSCELMERRLT